ncbi:MAG: hypothetical protein HY288_01280 [Planctomycetia bacterium]|nr:hypothetical protein [Planctomycetia bacterium]
MSRRRRSKPGGGTQLFSFLDAMICTMGALVVLLHAFARHGQIQIIKEKEPRAAQREQELQAEREDLRWRTSHLQQARAKTEAQLAEERLKLSHVEDHQRRLRQRFEQLKIAAAELERAGSARTQQRGQALADLDATKAKVRETRQAVENARREAQEKVANYTIVPYEGPNHTTRRPVYIECRADSVVLQPEGIELLPGDFIGVLAAGNPLAAALRSTREYLAKQSAGAKLKSEPYPLLLVRPDGIEAYYAARAALDSWASEFGYELIGADWQLKFPEPDQQLAELTRQVLTEARLRQREYLATSPQLAKNRARPTFHASSHGGFVPERGSRGGRGGSGGSGPGGWDSLGSNWARRSGTPGDGNQEGGTGSDPAGSVGVGNGTGLSGYGGPGNGQGVESRGNYAADGTLPDGSRAASGERFGGESGTNGSGQNASRYSGGDTGRYGQSAVGTGGGTGSRPDRGNQDDASALASTTDASDSSGGSGSSSGSGSSGNSGSSDSSPGSPSGSVSVGVGVGGPTSSASASQNQKHTSLAKTRGQDWGLPDGGAGSAAATRPIMIQCYNDRLVILPESQSESAQVTRLGPKAQDSMDEFVSHVWQHMKGWGMAGKALHWRPTLLMQVEPGAADRYAEVKALLADSGLDVHERQPRSTAIAPAKKTTRK